MSALLNGNRSGGLDGPPMPIPSLSFSLSTPPELSPNDEASFIPLGASCSYSTSPPSTLTEATKVGGSSPVQIDSARGGDEPLQCSHGGDSLLGAQPGMGRRLSSQVISEGGGEIFPSDMSSSISAFLESKFEAENLVTVSPDSETRSLVDFSAKDRGMKDPQLVSVASVFVSEVISKAKEEALRNSDEVTEKASLLNSGNLRDRRRGPWYARAVRFLTTVFGRMCPCRTTGEP